MNFNIAVKDVYCNACKEHKDAIGAFYTRAHFDEVTWDRSFQGWETVNGWWHCPECLEKAKAEKSQTMMTLMEMPKGTIFLSKVDEPFKVVSPWDPDEMVAIVRREHCRIDMIPQYDSYKAWGHSNHKYKVIRKKGEK